MNNEQTIKEMAKAIPCDIIRYDQKPKGQHLYIEQREEIAEALLKEGYGNIKKVREKTINEIFYMLYTQIMETVQPSPEEQDNSFVRGILGARQRILLILDDIKKRAVGL